MPIPTLPPLPAIGSIAIEIYGTGGYGPSTARWDIAATTWDGTTMFWGNDPGWYDVTPESLTAEVKWGADDPQGMLTVPAASKWNIKTYDPQRKLDPLNGISDYADLLKPGHPFRILFKPTDEEAWTVRTGYIDEIEYDLASKQGAVRGSDGVQMMVAAVLPAGLDTDVNMPTTLRARADYLTKLAGLQNIIKVESYRDWAAIVRELRPFRWYRLNEKLATDPIRDWAAGLSGYYSGEGTVPQMQKPTLVADANKSVWVDGFGSVNLPTWNLPQWSLTFWLRWDDTLIREAKTTSPRGPLVNNYGGELVGFGDIQMWIESDGMIRIGKLSEPGVYRLESLYPVPVDTLSHMITLQESAAGLGLFIDGVDAIGFSAEWVQEAKAGPCTLALATPTLSNWIGWGGYVDEPIVYDRLLSADEVARLYSYGSGLGDDFDPPVGPVIPRETSLWAQITTSAYDALYAVWLDRLNIVRFRSFGKPRSLGIQIGGLAGQGLETLLSGASMQGVFTRVKGYDVVGYDPDNPVSVEAINPPARDLYGDILLHRQQPVPDADVWVNAVLQDRKGASIQIAPGTIRPQTDDDMRDLLTLGMVDEVNLVVERAYPQIAITPRVLGGVFRAQTDAGWSAELVTYLPASEWQDLRGPDRPPWDPSKPTVSAWRTYTATQSARLVQTPTANGGNGLSPTCGIGAFGNKNRSRMSIRFPDIDFTDVVGIDSVELHLWTTDEHCILFGNYPKIIIQRIIGGWNEGTFGTDCSWSTTNTTVYPGPKTTQLGQRIKQVPRTHDTEVIAYIGDIVRDWWNGEPQYGIKIIAEGEDNPARAIEFYGAHSTNAAFKPTLRVRVRVPA